MEPLMMERKREIMGGAAGEFMSQTKHGSTIDRPTRQWYQWFMGYTNWPRRTFVNH